MSQDTPRIKMKIFDESNKEIFKAKGELPKVKDDALKFMRIKF